MKLGLSLSLGSQGGGAELPLRLVATRVSFPDGTNGNNQILGRTGHVAGDDITSIALAYGNFRTSSTTSGETANSNSSTIYARVEYPANTFTDITFDGGAASGTIAGGSAGVIVSDEVTLATPIPAGATFWVRTLRNCTGQAIYSTTRDSAIGDMTTAAASGLTISSTITNVGSLRVAPLLILSRTATDSICIIGDSKSKGYLDTADRWAEDKGEIARSIPLDQPYANYSSGGMQAATWGANAAARATLLSYFSHYVVNLGHNDIFVGVTGAAAAQAAIESIIADILTANPAALITVGTQTHKSSSTDSWATTGNQTTNGNNAARITLNATIRAGSIAGNNNGYFEISDVVETSRGSGIWLAPGYTTDGFHETATGYAAIESSGNVDIAAMLAGTL